MAHKIKYHKTQWQYYVFERVEGKSKLVKKFKKEIEATYFCQKNAKYWYERVH